ncbi:hypothetical protein FZ025_14710 [Xanthomonas hyacinthi]|uniref:hypothetical protein n=1 Tax=Xanthomonas hyacinthi TaxID=56455 RepID=UPI000AB22DDB|nr:hypothetical protein [Xanthomonas hyacinthi]QGY77829.1 hypothetical protein FZ025_14710 [Xanthomonas hyacinthi]
MVEGRLALHQGEPAWAAILKAGDKCAKLALPDSFYIDAKNWKEKKVRVVGRAFQQPEMAMDDGVMFWYAEKERKLAFGMCDGGIGIYVESMRANGKEWPTPAK